MENMDIIKNIILKQIEIRNKERILELKESSYLSSKNKISEYEQEIEKLNDEIEEIEHSYFDQVFKINLFKESIWYTVFVVIVMITSYPVFFKMSGKTILMYVMLVVYVFLIKIGYDNKVRDKKLSLMFNEKLNNDIEYQNKKDLVDLKNKELDKLVSECYDIKNDIELIKDIIKNMKSELDFMLVDVNTNDNDCVETIGIKRVRKISD